ncbi:MAG: NADH-quinone oxidoreductase subunit L, partial [Actinobacteria bacterium]|nr:NADH-quinone oxidoreductase subunit L [Actinomycetota bacterium]
SMTGPLIVLAVPSLLIGAALGLPPENGHIEHFLEPVFELVSGEKHVFGATDGGLMALSALIGLGGILLAWQFYVKRPQLPARAGARAGILYRLALNKYYIDEIYFALIINPVQALARGLWRFVDVAGIDGLANGSARFFKGVGTMLKPSQSGKVQAYMFTMFLGLMALMLAYWILTL